MKATSAVDVCNLALGELGNKPITKLTSPSTNEEVICAKHYDNTRRAVLRSHIWNFAKFRMVLSRTGTPAFEFTDQYLLPNDYIRFVQARTVDGQQFFKEDYDIADSRLLLNAGGAVAVNFTYIYDHDVVTKWDPLFLKLMVLNLAKDMSYEITRKNTVKDSILNEISLIEGRIKGIDGQEKPPRRVENSRLTTLRRGLTNVASKFNGVR